MVETTADSYFRHIPKAAILQAVGEFAPEHANRLAKLKKTDSASEAERLVTGTDWMSAIFRPQVTQDAEQEESAKQSATDELAEALVA